MNSVGPSMASAPSATTWPVLVADPPPMMSSLRATITVSTPAANSPNRASTTWIR